MRIFSAVSICIIILAGCQENQKENIPSKSDQIQSIVIKQKELFEAPGMAVGMIQNDSIIYGGAYGVKELGTTDSLTTKSLFHMASVSKPFVATAIIQLVESEKIDLDEKLTHYLPYFTMADERYQEITIRQMLSHTSGIPDVDDYEWNNPQYDDGAAERFTRTQKTVGLDFTPGERFSYSNTAFDILCDVISKVSGTTFENYMKENVFEPVGMKNSTFFKPEVKEELATKPHVFGDNLQKIVSPIYPYNRRHAGSSTLHSNVEDMLKWAQVNLNKGEINGKRIYSETSYEILTSIQTPENQEKVGLSWFLGDLNESEIVFHSGGDTGYSSFFAFLPQKKAAIVMMANTDNFWSFDNSAILLKRVIFNDSISNSAPIHFKLKNHVLSEGIDKMKEIYFSEKERNPPVYEFDGGYLDDLGYWLLDINQANKALDVFMFNTELQPEDAGWVDSVADAYRAMDSTDLAIKWYEKALKMNPEQDFSKRKLDELLGN